MSCERSVRKVGREGERKEGGWKEGGRARGKKGEK